MSITAREPAARKMLADDAGRTMQLVSFRLGDEEFAVEITRVREIILMGAITKVPEMPSYLKGLINLRSAVIPVIDLRTRFSLSDAETTAHSRIMVMNVGTKTVGIIVDAVSEVLRVSRDQIAPPPPAVMGVGHEFLTGLVRLEDRLLILLDVDQILDVTHVAAIESNSVDSY